MRLIHYLLLATFHLLVFHSWSRGDEPARFEVVNRMEAQPAFTVVNRLPAASATPAPSAVPEGFRDNWPGVGIVEYRGGSWRVLPPTPSQYAAPGGQPHPFAYGPPAQWHTAGTPAHHAATTPTPRPTFSAGAAPYPAPMFTLAPAAQRRGSTSGCSSGYG